MKYAQEALANGIRTGERPRFIRTEYGVFGQKFQQRQADTDRTKEKGSAGGAYGRGDPQ